jgi:transcriptional regulator with XRE-family HTH domain
MLFGRIVPACDFLLPSLPKEPAEMETDPEIVLVSDDSVASATHRLCGRVKELRTRRQWTLEQLAKTCGVSRSMLSQIERRQVNPTFSVAYRIAQALGVSLGELVNEPPPARIDVVRGEDPKYHFRRDMGHSIRTLYPMHLERDVEFYEVKLQPGGELRSMPHLEGTREFLTVQKGRIRVVSGADSVLLSGGDSARYPADVEHAICNVGRGEALAFLVAVYRTDPL